MIIILVWNLNKVETTHAFWNCIRSGKRVVGLVSLKDYQTESPVKAQQLSWTLLEVA